MFTFPYNLTIWMKMNFVKTVNSLTFTAENLHNGCKNFLAKTRINLENFLSSWTLFTKKNNT